MTVNAKKSKVFKNPTNYFDPSKDRVKVRVASPDSYYSREQKIEGFESRLYWQFKYCEDIGGQTYFYTLTYNDEHIPNKYGFHCFDYEDLRDLLTGGFRKQLLRKYGTTFKYFIGSELGDGKGKRGMHNNPHYHILFFLEPAKDCRFPYVVISSVEFRTLVRRYWQGFDECVDGYRSYQEARYGIAREGLNCGKVIDFRAISYVAKYVCKDVRLKANESYVENFIRFRAVQDYKFSEQSYKDYFFGRIYDMFNIPRNPKRTEWTFSSAELVQRLESKVYGDEPIICDSDMSFPVYWPFVMRILKKFNLWEDYAKFVDVHAEILVQDALRDYRNRYCNKARISQGVGEYALKTINPMRPRVRVPSKVGFKERPISLFYYRRLYTDKVKDVRSGNTLYILNEVGRSYKLSKLPERLQAKASDAETLLSSVINDAELFERMRESDVNTEVYFHHSSFVDYFNSLVDRFGQFELFKRYAEYKLVYEDRFYSYRFQGSDSFVSVPGIDVYRDYQRFLVPSFLSVPRNDLLLDSFISCGTKDYLPYYSHPYFSCMCGLFSVLDLVSDYLFVQTDNHNEEEAKRIADVKRFHNKMKLQEFYSKFN